MSIPKSIAIGLVKAQVYARGVEKLGRNKSSGGYNYATSEDIIVEGRKSLLEGGRLAFAVMGWTFETLDTGPARTKVKDGETKTLAAATGRIKVKYLLLGLDDGEMYEGETSAPVVPEFGRPDDKAEYGALTQCHAYTLRGLLNLPRGLAGEVDMNQRSETPEDDARPPTSDDRAPSDRPARSPGDHAAAAQTGVDQSRGNPVRGPAADVPTYDPAHVALADDFERKANALKDDPAPLYNTILGVQLPEALARRALFAVIMAAFRLAPSVEALDHWKDLAGKIKWGAPYAGQLKEAFERADAELTNSSSAA